MKFYYFYKITNLINGKFYYGVHQTNNLDDGYMGSGIGINRAYKKYGVQNFQKEILHYFSNAEEMYAYEETIVNNTLVKDTNCYNQVIGGRNNVVMKKLADKARLHNQDEVIRQKRNEGINRYWHTGDVEAKKQKQSIANRKFWNSEKGQKARIALSEKLKQTHIDHPEISKKISEKLNEYWSSGDIEHKRKLRSECTKNSEKHKQASKRFKESGMFKGINNGDFKKRWKPLYDKHLDKICALIKFSNLPERFIVRELFGLKANAERIIKYAITIGKLEKPLENKVVYGHRFLRLLNNDRNGHLDGGSRKTIFGEEKYHIVFLYNDFFEQFEKIVALMNDNTISDSAIFTNKKTMNVIPNFKQVLQYFEELNIVSNIHKIVIRVPKVVSGKHFTVPAAKTKFDIDYKKFNATLIDKEFNHYGIDDNGRPFPKGRFELGNDGQEHTL